MKYTIDTRPNQPDFTIDYGCFRPGMVKVGNGYPIICYVKDLDLFHCQDVHFSNWSEGSIIGFHEKLARDELDVLQSDGRNIGWIVRNKIESLQILQQLNNLPVS